MIKSFIFENFKSFKKAELNLESITSLIGSNSSGKSFYSSYCNESFRNP